ncbi:MAG TPA: prephenate dehydrogenase [Actinomycetaceae bacterium]|nr:prephenate dehydrogenase [Actinomycetaceae bacterium]
MAPLGVLPARVLIIGSGLLGASLGLALREHEVEVWLSDTSPAALHLARDLGAGSVMTDRTDSPELVVVATPPDVVVPTVIAAFETYPGALVTDVASVKGPIESDVLGAAGDDGARYIGSHPMAGRERSGAAAADADLFHGRTWVICPHDGMVSGAVGTVRAVATAVGALPLEMAAAEHDDAVAAVSHLPQLMSSLTAAGLGSVRAEALGLAGQGLRDTTRIAASDPMMWSAILSANAAAVLPHAEAARDQLDAVVEALRLAADRGVEAEGVMGTFAGVIERGRDGVSRIPGKHGGAARRYAEVTVLIPDRPGQLGRLFGDVGDAGVNIEDFRIEHSAGAKQGVATLLVVPARAAGLIEHLEAQEWQVMEL